MFNFITTLLKTELYFLEEKPQAKVQIKPI